jgi:hypothetical protein
MDPNNHHIMKFHPHKNNHFIICNPPLFVSDIVIKHFHLKMLGAFVNKLERYGFQQVEKKTIPRYAFTKPPSPSSQSPNRCDKSSTVPDIHRATNTHASTTDSEESKLALLAQVVHDDMHSHMHNTITFYHPLFRQGDWDVLDQIKPTVSRHGKNCKHAKNTKN